MKENTLLFLKEWFHTYVRGFYSEDEKVHFHIRLKEEHTLRVIKHAAAIAGWLNCSTKEVQMAEIVALLHDIGRFKQYETYRTFNDGLSVNHAELGVEVLEQSDILSAAGLTEEEQDRVKKAVLYHNRRRLPLEIEEGYLVLSKIIRDADRLDILAMLFTDDKENKIHTPPELKEVAEYSQIIIQDILHNKLVQPKDMKSSADSVLFRLSWIYDMYFAYSFSYMLEQQYLEKMINLLPNTEDIRCMYRHVSQYAKQHSNV